MYTTAGKIQLMAAIAAIALPMNGRRDTSIPHAMDNADHITRPFIFHCPENYSCEAQRRPESLSDFSAHLLKPAHHLHLASEMT